MDADLTPLDVLVVCTGNQCRSPMVEAMLRPALIDRGVAAVVHSAGTTTGGRPATDEVLELLRARGLDGSGHVSTELDAELVERADLVIGMAREHVRAASVLQPGAFARCFTLRELVRRGSEVGARAPGEPLAAWLARVGHERRPVDLLGASDLDDVPDPIGRRFKVFRKMAADLDGLVPALVGLAFPVGST